MFHGWQLTDDGLHRNLGSVSHQALVCPMAYLTVMDVSTAALQLTIELIYSFKYSSTCTSLQINTMYQENAI
jgi:hypothetical protein